tara:strand:- start:2097 stop:2885 length:789 start_codon:yes stop_codon:yes gene_type:complete
MNNKKGKTLKKRVLKKRVSKKTKSKKNQSTKKGGNPIKLSGMIKPTEGESIFESYLTILTDLIGVQGIYKKIIAPYNVYVIKSKNCATPWNQSSITDKSSFIYYCCKDEEYEGTVCNPIYTHYKVIEYNNTGRTNRLSPEIIDPYHLYQKHGSHGFCQMFARFIINKDVDEFTNITEVSSDINKKDVFQHNTYQCLLKTLKIIKETPEIYNDMEEFYKTEIMNNKEERTIKGIRKNMKFEQFITDLYLFKLSDVKEYIEDLY